jgi:hypothetical protein
MENAAVKEKEEGRSVRDVNAERGLQIGKEYHIVCLEYREREVRRFWDLARKRAVPMSIRILERDISAFNNHPV